MSLSDAISPAGMKRLMAFTIMAVMIAAYFIRRYYRKQIKPPLRIRYRMWYSGGLKMTVTIRNRSRMMVEIGQPSIEFRKNRMKRRRFSVITPGGQHLFPLGLAPQTSYDFKVEFTNLYERDERLRKYPKVRIIASDRQGKTIIARTVKVRMP